MLHARAVALYTKSRTPVTVTVCTVFQFEPLNTSGEPLTEAWPATLDVAVTVTDAVGSDVRTTPNVACEPLSLTDKPDVGDTVKPDESTSTFVTETSKLEPANAVSPLRDNATTYDTSPSTTCSVAPVTVTVCVTLQVAAENVRLDGLTVPDAVLLDDTDTVTLAVGGPDSVTPKDAVAPEPTVVREDDDTTATAASTFVVEPDTDDRV